MHFTRFSAFLTLFSVLLAPALPARAQCSAGWTPGSGTAIHIRAMLRTTSGEVIVAGRTDGYPAGAGGGLPPFVGITSFNLTTGAWSALGNKEGVLQGETKAIAELPGGDIVATGLFYEYPGVSLTGIARFNPTTRLWSGMGGGFNRTSTLGYGQALAVLPGGDLIAGGKFTTVSGVAVSNIARYNPTTGAWSTLGTGTNDEVRALTVLANGDLIVAGTFSTAGGVTTGGVARYKPSTGAWSSLATAAAPGASALAVTSAGDIIAAGGNAVYRWNQSTKLWSALGTAAGNVNALAVLPGGDILAGGDFTAVGSVSASSAARYNWSTGTWSAAGNATFGGGFGKEIRSLLVLPDGDFLAGGLFSLTVNNIQTRDIARCNPATKVWSEVGSKAAPDNIYMKMTATSDGDVFAVGSFHKVGAVNVHSIAKFSATTGVWSALAGDPNAVIRYVAPLPDDDVVIVGNFSTLAGVPANNIVRYNKKAGTWSALGAGVNAAAYFAHVLPGGDLFVGGDFTSAGGIPVNGLARYNFATGTWAAAGNGVDYSEGIRGMVALPDGTVAVCGGFNVIGGVETWGLARYNPTTGVWSKFGDAYGGDYYDLAIGVDGRLWVVGSFELNGWRHMAAYNLATGDCEVIEDIPSKNSFYAYYSLAPFRNGFVVTGDFAFTNDRFPIAYYDALYELGWDVLQGTQGSFLSCNVVKVPDIGIAVGGQFISSPDNGYAIQNAGFGFYREGGWLVKIRNPLASQSACRAGSASFTVDAIADAGSATYQWRKDGVPIDGVLNPSALSATLNLSNIQSSAIYDCVVNGLCGTAISNPATLTVCASDLNCDTYVDDSDFQVFVVQYNILDCADPTMPAGCAADINQDGFVDDADFQQFVVAYNQLLCN